MPEAKNRIQDFVQKHGNRRELLLPLLKEINEYGLPLDEETLLAIADDFQLSPADVYGVASGYPYLSVAPFGKYTIRLCRNISCTMKNQSEILLAISRYLKIKVGETTVDKKFTLVQANCLGWCHKAPAMLINHEVFTELTPAKAIQIINDYMQK